MDVQKGKEVKKAVLDRNLHVILDYLLRHASDEICDLVLLVVYSFCCRSVILFLLRLLLWTLFATLSIIESNFDMTLH